MASREISVLDPLGNLSQTRYDAANRKIATVDPLNNHTTLILDAASRQIATQNPLNQRSTVVYDAAGRSVAAVNALGFRTTTVYDPANRDIVKVDALANRTTQVFDAASRKIATVDALSHRVTLSYDGANRQVATTNPLSQRSTTVYDAAGRTIAAVDPLLHRSTTVYDAANREVVKIDALANRTTQVFDADNRKIRVINARGYATTTVYDNAGRTVVTIDALLNRSTFVYDAAGRRIVERNALGNRTTTIYDAASRKAATINPLGNRTSFGFDAASRQVRVKDPLSNVATTVFDAAGRAIANVNPLAYRTTHVFDAAGQQIATRDANLNRTTSVYDPVGRVQATIDGNAQRTTNVFDAAGRKIALVDPRANRNTFAFDAAGREVRRANPLSQLTTLAYDAAGRQTLRLDARGNRTSYVFDAVNRVTNRQYPDGSRVTFAFDPVGNRPQMADSTGRYTTTFDALNRTITTVNPASKRCTYAYDAIGERTLTISPDGDRFTHTWDANRRMAKILNPQAATTTFVYDAADRRTVKEVGNGTRASFTFDNASRMTRLVNLKSSSATISSFGYQYDKTTRRTAVIEATGDRVTWSYDSAYQLLNEKRSGVNSYNVTYTYDPMGNRTLKNDSGTLTTSTYDAANRQIYKLDGTGRTTFTFDATGNQAKQVAPSLDITTSVWDFENMNTATVTPSSRVTLIYSGDKLRVEKDSSTSGTARFVYDGQNILLETDGSNLTQAVYTLEPKEFGKLISQRQLQMGVWVPIYHAFDALGSTDSLTDSAAVVIDTYTYFAFGKTKAATGSTPNRFTWVGELMYMQDPETGEVQLHIRQTDPDRGRWKSEDPKGLGPDVNSYRIVTNNPVSAVDPSGLDPDARNGGADRFVTGPNQQEYTMEEIAEFERQIYMDGKSPSWWGFFPGGHHLYVMGQHLPEQRTPAIVMPGQPEQNGKRLPGLKLIALIAVQTGRSSRSETFIGLYNHANGKVTRNGVDLPLKYVLDMATGQNGYRQPTGEYWDSVFRPLEEVDLMTGNVSYESTPTGGGGGTVGESKRAVQPLLGAMVLSVLAEAAMQYIGGPLAGKAVGFTLSKTGGALAAVFKKDGKYFLKELSEAETARVIKSLKNKAAGGSDEAARALNQWAKSEGKVGAQAAKAAQEARFANLYPVKNWKSSNTWDTGKNSSILRENLGSAIKAGEDAHHIVQSTHPRAAASRKLLDKYQIDINDGVNGVGLVPSGPKPAHHGHGLHSYDGIDKVTERLKDSVAGVDDWATARKNLLGELEKLKKEIGGGDFP